jgi:hypothetical protein
VAVLKYQHSNVGHQNRSKHLVVLGE